VAYPTSAGKEKIKGMPDFIENVIKLGMLHNGVMCWSSLFALGLLFDSTQILCSSKTLSNNNSCRNRSPSHQISDCNTFEKSQPIFDIV
jgi:hypothetical protein